MVILMRVMLTVVVIGGLMLTGCGGNGESSGTGSTASEEPALTVDSTCADWNEATREERHAFADDAYASTSGFPDADTLYGTVGLQCASMEDYPDQAEAFSLGQVVTADVAPGSGGSCTSRPEIDPSLPPC